MKSRGFMKRNCKKVGGDIFQMVACDAGMQGRSQWGGRGGRLPPRTLKIGKESKNREGEKGGKERKKRERKRKEKREGRRERKRKGKGKGKGEEKEKKERKGKEKRRKGKREGKGERKRGKKGTFCVKVITKLREFSIKIPKSSSFWGGHIPPQTPPCARKRAIGANAPPGSSPTLPPRTVMAGYAPAGMPRFHGYRKLIHM